MRSRRTATLVALTLSILINLMPAFAVAQDEANSQEKAHDSFELKEGDRVVFLGNSLFEHGLPYGYLEFLLTTRWPNREVTFRNIGWTGDTVLGEARSYITSPSGYDLLMQQLEEVQPTVVILGYGANEAFNGKTGLDQFTRGLNQLLEKIEQLGADAVLLSPIPMMGSGSPEELLERNKNLELYSAAIAKIASKKDKKFIDIFNPLLKHKEMRLSDNGFHLNETGYYFLASIIKEQLRLSPRSDERIVLDVSESNVEAATMPVEIVNSNQKDKVRFEIRQEYLPMPQPEKGKEGIEDQFILRIKGLEKGFYELSANDKPIASASAKQWKKGVDIREGALSYQSRKLREMIVKKNELFFRQYRPLNRTYITGFRSHEQGKHAKGLEDLNIIIQWLEGQISSNSRPRSKVYQLTPIK